MFDDTEHQYIEPIVIIENGHSEAEGTGFNNNEKKV